MFSGTWSFTLVYTGSDKKQHMQICDSNVDNLGTEHPVEAAPIEAIPAAVSHVQIVGPGNEGFLVSWTGIGDNGGNIDYRIEIFTPDDVCVEVVYRMVWRIPPAPGTCPEGQECVGTYDPALNRVSFIVPGRYSGCLVRLSQHIIAPYKAWPRAMKQIRLPE